MSTFHARGIVLRRELWRDAARLYTVYTRETGKLSVVGRGTRRLLSKLGAHLEPYTLVDLHLAHGRKTETVCGAITRRPSERLASSEGRYLAACFTAEAIDHFVKAGERDDALWSLIDGWYADLDALPEEHVGERLAAFVWCFMSHLGYRPNLDECLECARPLRNETVRFLPIRGAAACRSCPVDERALAGAIAISPEAHRSLAESADAPSVVFAAPALHAAALALLEARLDRPLASLPLVRAQWAPARAILEAYVA